MAHLLRDACQREHLPPPHIHFPSRNHIRRIAPSLANRIAAFPGRRGYGRLAEFINPPPLSDTVLSTSSHLPASPALSQSTTSSGIWRNTPNVFAHLANHQKHPRVLPRLCSLPSNLASAIQRQGGASVFASRHAMVLEKDWANVDRLSKLVSFLADYVDNLYHPNPDVLYLDIVSAQSTALPPFPPADIVEAAAMTQEIQRYGGKRSLALRFGFSKDHCIKGLFMGPFSVRLAADLLQYATTQVSVAKDGSVAMPSIASLRADGLGHLVAAISFFGGEEVVGRRIGLVPITPKPPFTQPSSSEITNIWMP